MHEKILLVEDDEAARIMLALALEEAGYAVTQAASGEMALDILKQKEALGQVFEVIVTDIRMQMVDGIQLLQQTQNLEQPPFVILLTGFGSLDSALTAFRSGAYDYLLKPCSTDEMLACVDKALRHRKTRRNLEEGFSLIARGLSHIQGRFSEEAEVSSDTMQAVEEKVRYMDIGSLRIDRFHHTVSLNERTLHITPIEYALLYCLADAGGQAMSYREIVQHTHGQDVENSEAYLLLKQHISNIRGKIPPEYLVNIRGIGYKLTPPE